jgi:hypothetical protein
MISFFGNNLTGRWRSPLVWQRCGGEDASAVIPAGYGGRRRRRGVRSVRLRPRDVCGQHVLFEWRAFWMPIARPFSH